MFSYGRLALYLDNMLFASFILFIAEFKHYGRFIKRTLQEWKFGPQLSSTLTVL